MRLLVAATGGTEKYGADRYRSRRQVFGIRRLQHRLSGIDASGRIGLPNVRADLTAVEVRNEANRGSAAPCASGHLSD